MLSSSSADAHPGVTIVNPYQNYSYNYKGNLHAHSNNGNGATESPVSVATWYKNDGYAFYTITDHDKVTANPGVTGILWLGDGEEDSYDGSSGHMGHIGITSPITSGTDQARVNAVKNQGGFTVIHHPARGDYAGWTVAEICALNGILGLEVFNGGADMISTTIWDAVLTTGKLVWGIASDDSHATSWQGDGYIVVNSASPNPTANEIRSQIELGNFYASRGCNLTVSVANQTISASTTNGSSIRWIKQSGEVIETTNATHDTYEPFGDEGYVRIEILNNAGSAVAWSQPLTIPFSAYRPNGTLVIYQGKVYLLEEGKKRWVTTLATFNSYGFRWDRVEAISQAEFDQYLDGSAVPLRARPGTLITGSDGRVYVTDLIGGVYQKRWITSPESFLKFGFHWEDINHISDSEVRDNYTDGPTVTSADTTRPNGALLSYQGRIYLLEEGKRRWVKSPTVFNSLGFRWDRVHTVSVTELAQYADGVDLWARPGTLIKGSGAQVYVTDLIGGVYQKRWITSPVLFNHMGLHWSDIYVISDSELNTYTTTQIPMENPTTTFYVSTNGNDANPGTFEQPWRNPGYASRQLSPGETLIILGGRYVISQFDADIMLPPSGTAEAPIVIKGETGNRPVIAGRDNLFATMFLGGCSYVTVENLEITSDNGAPFRGGIDAASGLAEHITLRDLYIHHIDEFAMNLGDVNDILIENCRLTYTGFGAIGGPAGVAGGLRNMVVQDCELSYSGHYYQGGPGPSPYERPDGFGIEPSDGPIEIVNTVSEHNKGDGLDSKAANTYIHECIVANNSCDGVKLWGGGSKLENTLIYGTGDGVGGGSPWAGLVIDDGTHAGTTFEVINVTIHDNPIRQAYPMYVQYDYAVPINLVLRNTIISNGYGLVYIGDSVTLTAENNIFFRPGGSGQIYANSREYGAEELGLLGTGNLSANPLFTAPAWGSSGDYHLLAGSPAIDAGTATGVPSIDLEGITRPRGSFYDIGSYEF